MSLFAPLFMLTFIMSLLPNFTMIIAQTESNNNITTTSLSEAPKSTEELSSHLLVIICVTAVAVVCIFIAVVCLMHRRQDRTRKSKLAIEEVSNEKRVAEKGASTQKPKSTKVLMKYHKPYTVYREQDTLYGLPTIKTGIHEFNPAGQTADIVLPETATINQFGINATMTALQSATITQQTMTHAETHANKQSMKHEETHANKQSVTAKPSVIEDTVNNHTQPPITGTLQTMQTHT